MARRRGVRFRSGASRQLGSNDRRHRRNAQVEAVHQRSSDTVKEKDGRLEVVLGKGLTSDRNGIKISPGGSVTDAQDATEVVTRFNELLASLRAAGLLEE